MNATHVISTAGHVDHGKSTLVKALTGVDPDRFKQEQERGLTIDLGFGSCQLPSKRTVAIIDVPGHIRFLKNMLAGVGAVDACLFVVSAAEGWMPQSEEHLRILELLGVKYGVIALTQADLVDDEMLELAIADVSENVAGTFLESAPITPVDSISGAGLDILAKRLDAELDSTPRAKDEGRPRLWIDRSFAIKGSGTVVTGTLTGGSLSLDDELIVAPSMTKVRLRAIQSLQRSVETVSPGSRVALNLGGINHRELSRGDVLVRDGQWFHSATFDASLSVLSDLGHHVSRRGAYALYLGSGEVTVSLRVLGPDVIEAGQSGLVRLRLDRPYPLRPGDRFVLRESGRSETVGGGEVLDIDPVLKASEAAPDRDVDRVIAERGWTKSSVLELLTGQVREPNVGDWVVEPEAFQRSKTDLLQRINAAEGLGVALAELNERDRVLVQYLDGVELDGMHVRKFDTDLAFARHEYLAALNEALFEPPDAQGVDKAELAELVRRGFVIRSEGLHFSSEAIDVGAGRLADFLDAHPEGATVSQIREIWSTSRKFTLALLAYFDSNGMTRRRDDVRIAGPRLRPKS